ncbi:MAG TPA: hypothetical protein VK915_07500 [Gaiellaceae bacterium]|nr:hypothetical protein [Gaiellaceae bacterium]
MKKFLMLVALVLAGLALSTGTAWAQDHDHGGGGGSVGEFGTDNLMHMANSPRPTNATQSDLAFWGNLAVAGSYDGFRILDVTNQNKPREISRIHCNGAQGDVSIYGNLVFRSVDSPQSSTDCNSTNVTASTPGMFEGIQIFDISDVDNPVRIHSVPTDCGSHTHTLVPDAANDRVFLYISSYPLGGAALGPNCQSLQTGDGHSKVGIVEVPLSNPTAASVSYYNLDPGTEWATYLGAFTFRACHDISVFTGINRAAAACLSEGQVWDISDPAHPQFLYRYDNPNIKPENIDLFHSASFSWDGKIVAFGDESGGGGAARCVDPDDNQGRIWFLDAATGTELASYKIPRSEPGVCTMHNFNFIPQRQGNYTLVSSAYTGGTTVVNVNRLLAGQSEMMSEIAWRKPEGGNAWSSYWYNGNIYANDILRGLDVFLLRGGVHAPVVRLPYLNPQTQENVIN